ncbi:hypothetical protein DQ04_00261010 [Trypanosoma grayi]|uniref:hypothetical protein n=1 Tax=Trypanosoma grayi TaxID=71804 RepID=UPI0004F4907A|nr:hypothetical protein DQ04_00261010 [Trypanosoma grayi]KEG14902.1 hypothetical protein DQ04_00261010 [Trypanosoma grayi]
MAVCNQAKHGVWDAPMQPQHLTPRHHRGFLRCALLLFCCSFILLFRLNVDDNNTDRVAAVPIQTAKSRDGVSRMVQDEEKLWDRAAAQEEILHTQFAGLSPGSVGFNESLRRRIESIPQCKALGRPFLDYLQKYLLVHYYSPEDHRTARLIYSCESHRRGYACGGMGDRTRGMITAFWLALLSRRRFELYHPTPVPLQKYMPPHLLNYIPSLRNNVSRLQASIDRSSPKTFRESLSPLISDAPVDFRLMSIRRTKDYIVRQRKANRWVSQQPATGSEEWWSPQYAVRDLRVQCNSVGVDGFLYKDNDLFNVKMRVLNLEHCNISCYYGCLSHILLQPDGRLWGAAAELLRESQNRALVASLDGVRRPAPGQVFPFVSLQVRMAGAWATGLDVAETVRTFPCALPHYYAMTREVLTGEAWRRFPELFPANYLLRDLLRRGDSPVLFVSSDSARFVSEAARVLGDNSSVRVISVAGDSFRHIDTMNIADSGAAGHDDSAEVTREHAYFQVLLNYYLLGLASHSIMSQSGFSETAFWRSRQVASAIFVDVQPQQAWQYHCRYPEVSSDHLATEVRSAEAVHSRILHNLKAPPTPFYV